MVHTIKVPGKLYIVGEYAVLEAGQPAILVAIDAYLKCEITSADQLIINSSLISDEPYQYKRGELTDAKWAYITSAIQTVEQFVIEQRHKLQNYKLTYTTELVSESGDKYGLGSSGAVTIATVRALLAFYGFNELSNLEIYKLATIASLKVSDKGSFGDIAASSFGGWVFYRSLNKDWLTNKLASNTPMTQLIKSDWPNLEIKNLIMPDDIQLCIGWTHSPASTEQIVTKIQAQLDIGQKQYKQFLTQNEHIVVQLSEALEQADQPTIQMLLESARQLLIQFSKDYHFIIETLDLTKLVEIAEQYHFAAKSSGAGGGDCGIAIGKANDNTATLYEKWQQHNILPLYHQVTKNIN